jgi:hypothetical protein
MKNHLKVLLLISCIFYLNKVEGQQVDLTPERFNFENDLDYNTQIPSPASVLGYELGETYTIYNTAVDYIEKLAAASSKITVHEYGRTYENRPLMYMVISSEENQDNMEELRQNNLKLADPVNTPSVEANQIIEKDPVFISYSYNIHGNEASSTEAAMQVAYRLVAANDQETKDILDNSVIILYLCINPDGRDRFVYWYKSSENNVVATDPYEYEHDAPWPNGRTNHYWFDLNRDWIWGVHPESRGHSAVYQEWMPQVHTDYHEQGFNNNYFTVPGTTPRNKLLPDTYESLADTIGKANIAAFNKHKVMYFTREAFDFYYPGYGSSYPTVMGAIGMLTEQGGIGAGRAIETEDGYVLKLRQKIFDHYQTSMATIKKVVNQKSLFKNYFYQALNPANSKSSNKAYLLPDNGNMYINDVINVLLHHGVKVEKTEEALTLKSVLNYRTGVSELKNFDRGTYLISTNQAKHLFINTILQRRLSIEDSVMYDMATWSAPLAYNLEAYSTTISPIVKTQRVENKLKFEGNITNKNADYAYAIEWKQRYAPKALNMLWEKGYKVRSARKSFNDGDQVFTPGSIVILVGRNLDKSDEIAVDLEMIANEAKVKIKGFNTGRMQEGLDLGSGNMRPVKQPKVALMVDQPFDTYTSGQLWFLFDQETEMSISKIRTTSLNQASVPNFGRRYGSADLNNYDVLLLPGASVKNMKEVFDENALKDLKDWINRGGVLVATEDAAEYFTEKNSGFTKVDLVESSKDTSETAKYLKYEDITDFNGLKRIPGTALNNIIDNSNPLAFGLEKQCYALKFGNNAFEPTVEAQTVGYYDNEPNKIYTAGYASQVNLSKLSGKANAVVVPMGKGKVVLMLDNTQYRMFWRGPSRMIQNAVMLLKGM